MLYAMSLHVSDVILSSVISKCMDSVISYGLISLVSFKRLSKYVESNFINTVVFTVFN
jgi:hypothetical protein